MWRQLSRCSFCQRAKSACATGATARSSRSPLETLTQLYEGGPSGGSGSGNAREGAACSSVPESAAASPIYEPTPLSLQVRETRKGSDAQKRIKDNMLLAFGNLMSQLDTVHAAKQAEAPLGFEERHEERINFWYLDSRQAACAPS